MKFLRLRLVLARLGHGKTKQYELVSLGLMTSPVTMGGRAVLWPEDEIELISAARVAGADDEQIRGLVSRLHQKRQERAQALMAEVAA